MNLSGLKPEQVKEVQRLLNSKGYDVGAVDGIPGRNTRGKWRTFLLDFLKKYPEYICKDLMTDIKAKNESDKRLPMVDSIINECLTQNVKQVEKISYVLATAQLETNNTFKPVKEAYWLGEEWRQINLIYYPYYGRGLVQITWRANYDKFSKILGIDLVSKPDVVLNGYVSRFILVYGFKHGTFTGHKLDNHINDNKIDYFNARKCINWLDKATKIEDMAVKWEGYVTRYLNRL